MGSVHGQGSAGGGYVEAELAWLPATDPAATVRDDVNTLVNAPQLSPKIRVSGYVYNTAAGTLDTIVEPTSVGKRERAAGHFVLPRQG